MIWCSISLMAQNKAVDQLFRKYSDRDNFTSVVITKNMFQLFANVDNPNNDDFLKAIKNLEFIKILSVEGETEGITFYNDLLLAIPGKDYSELMTIKEPDNLVRFFTLEREGVVRELIMISKGKDESSLIWLAGTIDMKTVSKITSSIKVDGMENLEKATKH